MKEYFIYRYRLNKLLLERKKTKKLYDSYINEATKGSRERDERIAESITFINEIDIKIRELYTDYLQNIATKLIIPIPSFNDDSIWEKPMGFLKSILTNNGIHELKKLIRLKKKEKREVTFSWITILTGLLGTFIGLISVIKNC